ncbi:alpha/beta hydrolase [Ruania alkalisoli]|uniref:Alpha/beta hydrolase n=1 Tax=Ruania alkalisoli TaxID=2779775 RepID=A0A7M1SPZ7_9MICO|nr:alpha/beta hydrolase [Ruania alkalisoli]QOR69638.1 alpha/beta hydrolase [Ruania alkalisoli]
MLSVTAHGPAADLPLVLLHAFPLDSAMWAGVLEAMPEVGVLTVDAPGFGGSAPVEGGLEAYADAIAETLANQGIHRAVVAGLSMGGYTALALAERHPRLLAGLGLLDTKATADPDPARRKRLEMAEAALVDGATVVAPMIDVLLAPGAPEATRARVQDWLAQAPPSGIAWAQRAMAERPDRLAVLDGLEVPALVLRGSEDGVATGDDHEQMARTLGATVVELPAAGHLSAVEAPAPVARALADLAGRATAPR